MLKVKNLIKKYNDLAIINDISFDLKEGDVLSVIGASGSGKSTIIKCINGIESYQCGAIEVDQGRKIGTIFQSFNLFGHKTVIENITYTPINVLKQGGAYVNKRALEALDSFGLSDISEKYPKDISGGQKQRIAIIRTMMTDPDLILFDEPTSALDPENTREVAEAIIELSKKSTMIVVTHDMKLADAISDYIMFIDQGKILEYLPGKTFFKKSKHPKIKKFIEGVW